MERTLTGVWLTLWAAPWLLLVFWLSGGDVDLTSPVWMTACGLYVAVMVAGYVRITGGRGVR